MGSLARILAPRSGPSLFLRLLLTLILGALAVTMVLPLLWMISASFKLPQDVMSLPIRWIPETFRWQNYGVVWNIGVKAPRDYHFALSYLNSIKVTGLNLAGALTTSALAGYAFAKLRFPGRNALFLLYLTTMMIPAEITLIPKFMMFDWMKLLGTQWPIILPTLVTPTGTFLMRQYFLQLPDSLRESAVIDGARELRIWRSIMLPLAKPAVASLAVIVFMWHWNAFLEPLIFLRNWRQYTIPVNLTSFIDENVADYTLIMAASVSAMLPMLIVFLAGQKYFVKGLTAGAVKG
jgi:multiple sugar transport system permease protein